MSDVYKWSLDAASNDDSVPNGAPPGWNGEDVNDWGREVMRAVRAWYDAPEWVDPFYDLAPMGTYTITKDSDTQFTLSTKDGTAYLTAGTRIRIVDGSSNTHDMTVASDAVFATDTVVTIESGTVPTVPDTMLVHSSPALNGLVWGGFGTESERDTAFPPANGIGDFLTWYNTDTGSLDIGANNAWNSLSADGQSDSYIWSINSTNTDNTFIEEQEIKGGLRIGGAMGLRSETPDVSSPSGTGVAIDVYDNNTGFSRNLKTTIGIDTDGSISIQDDGESAVNIFGETWSITTDINNGDKGSWYSLGGDSMPSSGTVTRWLLTARIYTSTISTSYVSELDSIAILMNGDVLAHKPIVNTVMDTWHSDSGGNMSGHDGSLGSQTGANWSTIGTTNRANYNLPSTMAFGGASNATAYTEISAIWDDSWGTTGSWSVTGRIRWNHSGTDGTIDVSIRDESTLTIQPLRGL